MIIILYGGVLGRPNISLLLEEGTRRGLEVRAVHYSELSDEFVTPGVVWSKVKGMIFRGWYRYVEECKFALSIAKKHKIPMVDFGMLQLPPEYDFTTDKITQRELLRLGEVSVPRLFSDWKNIPEFPVVLKDRGGSKGKNVFLVSSSPELVQLHEQHRASAKSEFFVEEFIPSDGDFRVLVIGGKALPQALHRRPSSPQEFRSNISVGGVGAAVPLTPALRALAESAAEIENSEFCGVDIIQHRDTKKLYVLEVNRFAPGFEGFQKATGINVAGEVFELLVKKTTSAASLSTSY